jgi:hypothetical protein
VSVRHYPHALAALADRYRITYWVKTIRRETGTRMAFRIKIKGGESWGGVTRLLHYTEPPTQGQWRRVSRTLTLKTRGEYTLKLKSSYQPENRHTYFDDVELIRLH